MLTNKEKKLAIYSEEIKPTVAGDITHDTPLDAFNLNWAEKDLPQKVRTRHVHGLHPYLGKYVPQLVEIFLRKYFSQGETILDPFVGSGTTLVQANELGMNSIGFDISSFNVLLCKVKTSIYDIEKARKEANDVLEKTQMITQSEDFQLTLSENRQKYLEFPGVINEYLLSWYAPKALSELLTYKDFIDNGNYEYQDLLNVILTRSARSARLTTHFDLDFPKTPQKGEYWCYKHSRTCSPTDNAFKFLRRYTTDTIRRIEAFSAVRTEAKVDVYHGDSRMADVGKFDGIITSPPYVGLIDYHEQHAYAYSLLDLNDNRHREIGPASNGVSKNAKLQYQEDIAQVFKNITKNIRRDGRIIVVAGDKHNLYPEIARLAGLDTESIIKRHVNRRTGRRSSNFYESVFIWRKP